MSNSITITVTVDIDNIKQLKPGGGELTGRMLDSIVMHQEGGFFERSSQDSSNLVSLLEESCDVVWNIVSKNPAIQLEFKEYLGDGSTLNIFNSQPAALSKNAAQINGLSKSSASQNYESKYGMSFCESGNESVVWNWDPIIKYPHPPV